MLNPQNLSIEGKSREWSGLLGNVMIGGLIVIAFCLFFVRLNHIVEYMFLGLLGVWLLGQLQSGTLKWIKSPLDIPILLYVSWILICVPFAVDPDYSFGEWRKAVTQILLFYFVVQAVKTQRQIHSILLAGVAGIISLSLIESAYFLGQGRPLWTHSYRAGELTGNSQWLSVYLVIGLPILWIVWSSARGNPRWYRGLLWGGVAISFLGLFLAHTRGAWLAIGIQVFIYGILKLSSKWWVAFCGGGILVCGLLVILALPVQKEIANISVFTTTNSMQWRFNTWSLALQDIFESPVTGIGFGKHSFSRLHPDLGPGFHANLHNTFLARAVQVGVPGFLFFVWIFVLVIVKAAPLFQSFPNEWSGKLALGTSLIVVGVIVRNLFDDMFIGTVAYLFWLLMGLFFAMDKAISKKNLVGIG